MQIAKLDSEAWPGLLDPERDRLILINEKEELLKELQYVGPRQRLEPNDAQKLESEKKRLERDLQAARDNQSKALTERWVQEHPSVVQPKGLSQNSLHILKKGMKQEEENKPVEGCSSSFVHVVQPRDRSSLSPHVKVRIDGDRRVKLPAPSSRLLL